MPDNNDDMSPYCGQCGINCRDCFRDELRAQNIDHGCAENQGINEKDMLTQSEVERLNDLLLTETARLKFSSIEIHDLIYRLASLFPPEDLRLGLETLRAAIGFRRWNTSSEQLYNNLRAKYGETSAGLAEISSELALRRALGDIPTTAIDTSREATNGQ